MGQHPLLVIDMNHRDGCRCAICGGACSHCHGVPMLEGKLVSNDWDGPWVGLPACLDCYEAHANGRLQTHDSALTHYLRGAVADRAERGRAMKTRDARPWWWWINPWLYIKRRDAMVEAMSARRGGG